MTRMLAALLGLLVPVLVSTPGTPATATLVVAVALASALVVLAVQVGAPAVRSAPLVAVGDDAVPLVLAGRVVDPDAHPRAPRAPGRG
jgi:hypothetical protein